MIPLAGRDSVRLAVAAAIALASAPRLAQGEPADAEPADVEREARELYREGARHYNLADYDRAIELFERAYHLFQSPEFLFNVAQAHRLKGPGHCRKALHAYRAYLEQVPASPDRTTIEGWIPALETCADDEARRARAARPDPAPLASKGERDSSGRGHLWVSWSLIAGGALLVAGGTAMVLSVGGDYDDLEASCGSRCDPDDVDPLEQRERIGLAVMAGGAAAAVTGAVLLLLRTRASDASSRAAVAPARGGLLFTYELELE